MCEPTIVTLIDVCAHAVHNDCLGSCTKDLQHAKVDEPLAGWANVKFV